MSSITNNSPSSVDLYLNSSTPQEVTLPENNNNHYPIYHKDCGLLSTLVYQIQTIIGKSDGALSSSQRSKIAALMGEIRTLQDKMQAITDGPYSSELYSSLSNLEEEWTSITSGHNSSENTADFVKDLKNSSNAISQASFEAWLGSAVIQQLKVILYGLKLLEKEGNNPTLISELKSQFQKLLPTSNQWVQQLADEWSYAIKSGPPPLGVVDSLIAQIEGEVQ